MSKEDQLVDAEFEALKNSKFKQQKLPAWRPVPTITSTTATFLFFGVVFIIIGAVVLTFSNKVVEVSISYQNNCTIGQKQCPITFNISSDMATPVMFYYQLNNFYQNHRRYVKSKSNDQLNGKVITYDALKSAGDCDPVFTMGQLGLNMSVGGQFLNDSVAANPCGLIAKSMFNDTYALYTPSNINITINDTNIAWEADKELKFHRAINPNNSADTEYWKTVQWHDVEDEHFMVWMRPAGLPNFRKLWGRINSQNLTNPLTGVTTPLTNLSAGNYTLYINNNFDVSKFSGEKLFVLSTVNSFGGKNNFLGISYLVVGSICIVMAIAFCIGYRVHNNNQKKD